MMPNLASFALRLFFAFCFVVPNGSACVVGFGPTMHIAIPTDNGLSLLTQQALPLALSTTRSF
jgi:hypothetical protein